MPYPYTGPYQMYYPQAPMQDQLGQLRGGQYQSQMQPMQQPQPAGQSMLWVQSEAEALAYPVAPNSAVTLWDSNAPVVYLKQADSSGRPTMKIYDLVEHTQRPAQPAQAPAVEYATRAELEALAARLDAMAGMKTEKEDAQ